MTDGDRESWSSLGDPGQAKKYHYRSNSHFIYIKRFFYTSSSIVWRSFLIFQKESSGRIVKPGFNQPIRYQLAVECEFLKNLQVTKVGSRIVCRDGTIPPCKTVMIAVEQIRNEDGFQTSCCSLPRNFLGSQSLKLRLDFSLNEK